MAKSVKVPAAEPAPRRTETREEILLRLSGPRVEKAVKAISIIGNLAAYKPTSDDVDAIMMALGGACAVAESRLRGGKLTDYSFSLRDLPAPE